MKYQRSIMTFCVLVMVIAAAGSCSKDAEQDLTSEAVKVAESWLEVVDKGDYGKSWDQSAGLFKEAVAKAEWEKSLDIARTPLGENESRKMRSAKFATSLPGAPDGEYVVIQYDAVFANKESATETVTPMKDTDGNWRVSGYYIK
jgi:hypothetical protein